MSDPIVAALKAERQRQGLTLRQLGERLGRHTYQTAWQWETGTNEPKLGNLRQWAAALGYDLTLTRDGTVILHRECAAEKDAEVERLRAERDEARAGLERWKTDWTDAVVSAQEYQSCFEHELRRVVEVEAIIGRVRELVTVACMPCDDPECFSHYRPADEVFRDILAVLDDDNASPQPRTWARHCRCIFDRHCPAHGHGRPLDVTAEVATEDGKADSDG